MDRLTSLPVELLEMILKLAYKPGDPYLGTVCRAFLPVVRAIAFRTVTVHGCPAFTRYWAAICRDPVFAAATRSFVLRTDLIADTQDVPPSPNILRRLSRALKNVEDFVFSSYVCLGHIILAPTLQGPPLPALRHLHLALRDDGRFPVYDPRRCCTLHRYPQLDALRVDVTRGENLRWHPEKYRRYEGQLPADRSWWLSFEGFILDDPSFRNLLELFPLIDTLHLYDTTFSYLPHGASNSSFSTLLRSLTRPSALTGLSLSKIQGPVDDVLPFLSHFPNLSSLELGAMTFLPSSFPRLSSLSHLYRLAFLRGTSLSTKDAKPLLTLPSLRTLRLDLVYMPDPDPSSSFSPDSILSYPGWDDSFTPEAVGELLDLADGKGVKVVGLAAGLVRRERDYEERVARWLKRAEDGAVA
ncbi:hypothetical protein JCM6882_002759 [Rhodosporidiobolus microsporus]